MWRSDDGNPTSDLRTKSKVATVDTVWEKKSTKAFKSGMIWFSAFKIIPYFVLQILDKEELL